MEASGGKVINELDENDRTEIKITVRQDVLSEKDLGNVSGGNGGLGDGYDDWIDDQMEGA